MIRLLARFNVEDPAVANVVGLLAPYAAYLPADAIGVSGVLSAVTAGIYVSRRSQTIFTPEGRVIASGVWRVMILLLNGFVFLQIGLILPSIVRSLPPSLGRYIVACRGHQRRSDRGASCLGLPDRDRCGG